MSKKKERRREILNHALELFVEKGYHQTRTSEITEKVGIASGTLFNYFDKKEKIINTLYIEIKEELFSVIDSQKSPNEHIYNHLKKSWMNFVSWGIKNYTKVLFLLQMDDSPLIADEIKNKIETKVSDYLSIYQEGIIQGFLKDIPTVLAMELFYHAMVTTITYIVKLKPNITTAEQTEISEKAFNIYLYGIRI